jgi:hypothetical protein
VKKLFFIVLTLVASLPALASDYATLASQQKKLWDGLVSNTQKLFTTKDAAPGYIPYQPWMTVPERHIIDNINTAIWSQYRTSHYNKDKVSDENWKKSFDNFVKYLAKLHQSNAALERSKDNLNEEQAKFLERQLEQNQRRQDQLMLQNSIEGVRDDLLINELTQKRSVICQNLGGGTNYCY